jgi:hypothetical protein
VEVPCSGGSTQGSNTGGVAERAVNTIACGTPDVSGAFVATTLVCLLPLHTRLRTHRASGVPRALSIGGRDVHHTPRAQSRREIAKLRPNRCRCLTFEYEPDRDRSLRLPRGASSPPASSLRRQGPIRRVIHDSGGVHSAGKNQTDPIEPPRHPHSRQGLWVPAFAGTTMWIGMGNSTATILPGSALRTTRSDGRPSSPCRW